jgi:hypothetical protein
MDTSHFFPYIWLSSGDWLLRIVEGGGVSSSSFLGGFTLDSSERIWLANRWGEIVARILRGGYADARAYVEKVKLVWRWVILNSLFLFCIWHTRRLLSLIYDASKS